MSRRNLQIVTALLGLVPVITGVLTMMGVDDPLYASMHLPRDVTLDSNLRFFGAIYGLHGPRLAARVQWALDFVGLAPRARDGVATYSGGMKRRLNLAAALVHDPELLLLDEPTVGVDPQSRNALFDNIEALRREGRTVVYTTHYMEEAERLADRVVIIEVNDIQRNGVKLAFQADRDVIINREEVDGRINFLAPKE